jgi:transposase
MLIIESKGAKTMERNIEKYIGIDVSKEKLDIYESVGEKKYRVSNDKVGIKELKRKIGKKEGVRLIVIDLTGGYEKEVVERLYEEGYKIHRAQGLKVKMFARSYGERSKTDEIDAKILAIYGEKMEERLRKYSVEEKNEISGLEKRLEDIKGMIQKEKNRLENAREEEIEESIGRIISGLEEEREKIEGKIKEKIKSNEELEEKGKVIESQVGVGEKTKIVILAQLPELGKCNRREITALAGLAPYARDSGKIRGYRRTQRGRVSVKRALFMSAMVAIKHDRKMKEFYEKLISRAKKPLVAIVAVMRKIIVILNSKCKAYYAMKNTLNNNSLLVG